MIAVPVVGWQIYLAATGRAVVALPVLGWIVLATVLFWVGSLRRPTAARGSADPGRSGLAR